MLDDYSFPRTEPILAAIALMNDNPPQTWRTTTGVYQIGHFNWPGARGAVEEYPELGDFNSYGVCDSYEQILEQCPALQDPNRQFVITITPIVRANQSPEGGWRWHKWGPYIGTFNPQCEYLYDEVGIDRVFCFHIYELKDHVK